MSCFKYCFTSSLFLIGQLSSFEMCAISFSLSLFSLMQSYIRWSTVWLPLAQGHSGDSIILNRCKYDLVFPWAVIIAVNLEVKLIFIFNLPLMFGKNSLVHMFVWMYVCMYIYVCVNSFSTVVVYSHLFIVL